MFNKIPVGTVFTLPWDSAEFDSVEMGTLVVVVEHNPCYTDNDQWCVCHRPHLKVITVDGVVKSIGCSNSAAREVLNSAKPKNVEYMLTDL